MGKATNRKRRETVAVTEILDGPTQAQLANGDYVREFVMHAESATQSMANRNRVSSIVDKWFEERWPGFEYGAQLAINWCHKCWEARGHIGNLTANYEPTISSGTVTQFARDVELKDELDEVRSWFHPTHWSVFEDCVRWGKAAGIAGAALESNNAQAIAATRATVGLVANFIAMKRGY